MAAAVVLVTSPSSWRKHVGRVSQPPSRRWTATRLVAMGSSEQEALLVPKVALACFQAAYERWVRDPGQDLPDLVDESFAALAGLTG